MTTTFTIPLPNDAAELAPWLRAMGDALHECATRFEASNGPEGDGETQGQGCPDAGSLTPASRNVDGSVETFDYWREHNAPDVSDDCANGYRGTAELRPGPLDGETFAEYLSALDGTGWTHPGDHGPLDVWDGTMWVGPTP